MDVETFPTAAELFDGMLALDLSREQMENRLYEAEISANALHEQPERRKALLATLGQVRTLLNREPKLAAAGLLAGKRFLPYSRL